jgi:hypothetical protein
MRAIKVKLKLLGVLALVGLYFLPVAPAQAQWPPFEFKMTSLYENGRITYNLEFSPQVNWPMSDVVFKIPLPESTRFVEAGAPDSTTHSFDGVEITFFTPAMPRNLANTFFVVEVLNPAKTEYAAHAWIAWKGQQAGDFLTTDSTIDITRTPLTWQKPGAARLRLEAAAVVQGDEVTYYLYPVNRGGRRMWDVQIFMDLPAGTTLVSTEASAPFQAGVNGSQVVFSALELERRVKIAPLQIKVSTAGVTDPLLAASAWAGWTNAGTTASPQEQTETGQIIVQPRTRQVVVADAIGDTPFSSYDLTGVAFQPDGGTIKTIFYTVDAMAVGQPVEYFLYLDADCNKDTGKARGNRGAEYWVRYRHQTGKAYIYTWDAAQTTWVNRQNLNTFTAGGQSAAVWIPGNTLAALPEVCWLALAWNRTQAYHPAPPIDWVGVDPRLTRYVIQ